MGYRETGMQLTGNSQIRTIVALQLGGALAIGLLSLLIGKVEALSALSGGLIAALGNGFFALRAFGRYRAEEPGRIAARMFGAEIQKLILTGLMFVLAIMSITPLSIGALLGGYLIVQVVVPLVVTLIQDRQQS